MLYVYLVELEIFIQADKQEMGYIINGSEMVITGENKKRTLIFFCKLSLFYHH